MKWNKTEWDVAVDPAWADTSITVDGDDVPVQTNERGKFIKLQGMISQDQTFFYHKFKARHFKLHFAQLGVTLPYKFASATAAKKAADAIAGLIPGTPLNLHGAANATELAMNNGFGSYAEMLSSTDLVVPLPRFTG